MMSICRIPAWLAATMVLAAMAAPADAQNRVGTWNPFGEPMLGNHDLQFFKAWDSVDLDGTAPPSTGWFFAYDRAYLSISRPDSSFAGFEADLTWGNRFEIGFMTADDHGWLGTYWHVDGPGVLERIEVAELDRVPADVPPTNTIFLDTSRNVATLSSWDINKTFRLDPLHGGGIIEPYVGLRYMELRDKSFTADETRSIPAPPSTVLPTQTVDSIFFDTKNKMLGGQFGARMLYERGRWDLTGDVKMIGFQNYQFIRFREDVEVITYTAALAESSRELTVSEAAEDLNEFAFGMEIRAEAAFEVTRDVSLRFGLELMQFFKGLARGFDSFVDNSEDLNSVGWTFGVTVNR